MSKTVLSPYRYLLSWATAKLSLCYWLRVRHALFLGCYNDLLTRMGSSPFPFIPFMLRFMSSLDCISQYFLIGTAPHRKPYWTRQCVGVKAVNHTLEGLSLSSWFSVWALYLTLGPPTNCDSNRFDCLQLLSHTGTIWAASWPQLPKLEGRDALYSNSRGFPPLHTMLPCYWHLWGHPEITVVPIVENVQFSQLGRFSLQTLAM